MALVITGKILIVSKLRKKFHTEKKKNKKRIKIRVIRLFEIMTTAVFFHRLKSGK